MPPRPPHLQMPSDGSHLSGASQRTFFCTHRSVLLPLHELLPTKNAATNAAAPNESCLSMGAFKRAGQFADLRRRRKNESASAASGHSAGSSPVPEHELPLPWLK